MNHKKKVKLARQLRTQDELIERKPLFETKRWDERKEAIRKRVLRRQQRSKSKSLR